MSLELIWFAAISLAAPATAAPNPHAEMVRTVSKSIVRLSGTTTYSTYLDILRETVPEDVAVEISEEARNARHERIASGIVFDDNGHVVTTAAFAGSGNRIRAQLADGSTDEVSLVGLDPASDLAVLRLSSQRPPAARFVSDPSVIVSGTAVCIVAAGPGAKCAVTDGKLKRVSLKPGAGRLHDFLHIDTEPDPGAAGGAVTDADGAVLGMVSVRIIGSGTLALPAPTMIHVARTIIDHVATPRATLGVTVFTPALPRTTQTGVHIGGVVPDSPAALAGIQPGDIVVEFDGKPVTDVATLKRLVWSAKPDQQIGLGCRRDGVAFTVNARLAAEPVRLTSGRIVVRIATTYLGIDTTPVTVSTPAGEITGLLTAAVDPESPADLAGLRVTDVIIQLDRQPVRSPAEFHRLLNARQKGESVTLTVVRDGQRLGIRAVLDSSIEMARLPQEHYLVEPDMPLDDLGVSSPGADDMLRTIRQGLDSYRNELPAKP